jgi:hypothetical protein
MFSQAKLRNQGSGPLNHRAPPRILSGGSLGRLPGHNSVVSGMIHDQSAIRFPIEYTELNWS